MSDTTIPGTGLMVVKLPRGQNLFRWIFFLLGAVKLAAIHGIPWTKAFGMMFLTLPW